MTNMLQDGATWLSGQLKNSSGRVVTYRRGFRTVENLTATPYEQEAEVASAGGLNTVVTWYEWTIAAADLVIAGAVVEPQEGDQIIETLSGVTTTWEVMPVAKRKHFDWLDSSGILLKVRTKRAGRA